MEARVKIVSGMRFGRWTALEQRGERWLCRCDCGTEREVLARSLRCGGSLSCGCLARERAAENAGHELAGRRFGRLSVIERAPAKEKRAGRWWHCRCDCGREIDLPGTLLSTGKRTSCGCDSRRGHPPVDIAGRVFHRLTAIEPLKARSSGGNVVWRCRCECGRELDVSYNDLMYSNVRSCGCRKREHNGELKDLVTRVDGTSIDHLRSRKIPADNTTGVRGVYLIKGRYVAKIVFQKKAYYLGSFDDLETAAEVRREAEESINDQVVAIYDAWKVLAAADPEWAEANPLRFDVEKGQSGIRLSARLQSRDAGAPEHRKIV